MDIRKTDTWMRFVDPETKRKWMIEINTDEDIVVFYDGPQMASSYYIEDLLSDNYGGPIGDGCGLDLHSGVPEWSIGGDAIIEVAKFLKQYVNTKEVA